MTDTTKSTAKSTTKATGKSTAKVTAKVTAKATTESNQQNKKVADFWVRGMTCAACEAAVHRAVSKVEGVQEVTVNLLGKSMKVTLDPGLSENPEEKEKTLGQVIQSVKKAGYEAELQGKRPSGSGAESKAGQESQRIRRPGGQRPSELKETSPNKNSSEANQLFAEEAEELRQRLLYSLPLLGLLM